MKFRCPNKWTPKNKYNKPQLQVMEGQDFDADEHDCMPGPYSFLGMVFLRNCQILVEQNPSSPSTDIYWAVRNKILKEMGVDGTMLNAEDQFKKKEVIRALKPYNQLQHTLLRERRKYIPTDL